MIRRMSVKDTDTPPGQVVNPVGPDTLHRNIEQWQKYEASRKQAGGGCCHQTVLERCKDCPFQKEPE